MATDRELLLEAREKLKEQTAALEQLAEDKMLVGSIVAFTDKKKVIVSYGGEPIVVNAVDGAAIGDTVWLIDSTKQIFHRASHYGLGTVVDVKRVHPTGVEIDMNGRPMLIAAKKSLPISKGDRVLLDSSGMVVLSIIEKAKPAFVPKVTSIKWDAVGGNREAKMRLIEAIELPYKHPDIFKSYGKKPPSGILMWGPPGCGKTLLGKAVATALGSEGGEGGFISTKGPELLDPYVGVAEANIRSLFRTAEAWKCKTGRPGVIFVDEADALLASRGRAHNYMGQTIVPMFLTEMQGLEESGALVILATNRPDILDPAVLRDGRIDAKIEIPRPDQADAVEILEIHLDGRPLQREFNKKTLAKTVAEDLYAIPTEEPLPFSGALLEGVVLKASEHAIRRDLKAKSKTPSGLGMADFVQAMAEVVVQEGATLASE